MAPQKHFSDIANVAQAHALCYRGVENSYLVFERLSGDSISRADARLLAAAVYRELTASPDPSVGSFVNSAAGIRIA